MIKSDRMFTACRSAQEHSKICGCVLPREIDQKEMLLDFWRDVEVQNQIILSMSSDPFDLPMLETDKAKLKVVRDYAERILKVLMAEYPYVIADPH